VDFLSWRNLLFRPGEWVCGAVDAFGANSMLVSRLDSDYQFFAINPLKPGTRRKDENVAAYRNFLLEIDKLPLAEQEPAILALGIPFTSLVYSGGKSLHIIISLTEPCKTEREYRDLVERMMAAVPICDPTTKNPSRLSRVPTALRDNGTAQSLVALREAVPREALEAWLVSKGITEVPKGKGERVREAALRNRAEAKRLGVRAMPLSSRTWHFLKYGATSGKNHHEALQACFDMAACGVDADEAQDLLEAAPWPTVEENEIANIVLHVYSKI
jgi:hypothetical protein